MSLAQSKKTLGGAVEDERLVVLHSSLVGGTDCDLRWVFDGIETATENSFEKRLFDMKKDLWTATT